MAPGERQDEEERADGENAEPEEPLDGHRDDHARDRDREPDDGKERPPGGHGSANGSPGY